MLNSTVDRLTLILYPLLYIFYALALFTIVYAAGQMGTANPRVYVETPRNVLPYEAYPGASSPADQGAYTLNCSLPVNRLNSGCKPVLSTEYTF